MSWTARLSSITPQDAGSSVVTTINFDNDQTKERQTRSFQDRNFDMKVASNWAITIIAELDRRDIYIAKYQGFNDAIAAGKDFVLAQSLPDITVADGV